MKNRIFLQSLREAVSEEEYSQLREHTLPHINEFNRAVILEMLQITLLEEGEVSEEKAGALKGVLEDYLGIYLSDQKDAWKWIILSCLYLCFICHKPLHPQEMAHYIVELRDNKTVYYCPFKATEGITACSFCICKKM